MKHVVLDAAPAAGIPEACPCAAAPVTGRRFGAPEPLIDRSGRCPGVAVVRCRDCGTGTTVPPLDDLAILYADRDSQDFQPDTGGLVRRIKRMAFTFQARGLLRRLSTRPMRIVDVGCGSGLLTRCLGDVTEAEVIGVDFHDRPPAELGDRAYRSFAASDDLIGAADAVVAMHVLEHGDDVAALLVRIASYARPGGLVLIEVPNIDSLWASLFGRHWDGWYAPYHRVHFSRAGLTAAVARAGLTIERVEGVTVPGLGRSLASLLGRRNGAAFILATAVLHPLERLLETASGRRSGLRLLARVPERSAPPLA